jgi:hypothetical protein
VTISFSKNVLHHGVSECESEEGRKDGRKEGTHPASYVVGTRALSVGVKQPGH